MGSVILSRAIPRLSSQSFITSFYVRRHLYHYPPFAAFDGIIAGAQLAAQYYPEYERCFRKCGFFNERTYARL